MHFMFCAKRPILFTKSLWFHLSVNQCCHSAPVRAIYTSYGGRPVINTSPGTLQGSARAWKGSRPAPLDMVRFPLYLLTKIGKRNRAVPDRLPAGPLMQPAGVFTGCLRATGLNKTPGELVAYFGIKKLYLSILQKIQQIKKAYNSS